MLETMKRILTMAGKYRHKVTIGIIISLLHSFFSAMDLFAICWAYRKGNRQPFASGGER